MAETFIKEFLQEHAAQIERAARQCPPRGWTMLEARDECAIILGVFDEWQRLSSDCLASLADHERLYPHHWSRARKRLLSDWAGGALLRAISESEEGSEIRERLKGLSDQFVGLDLRLKGLLRALLRTGTWLAEGSVDSSSAPRTKIQPYAWDDLRVIDWGLDLASHMQATGLRGKGHVHGLRIRSADHRGETPHLEMPNPPIVDEDLDKDGWTQKQWVELAKKQHPGLAGPELLGARTWRIYNDWWRRRSKKQPPAPKKHPFDPRGFSKRAGEK